MANSDRVGDGRRIFPIRWSEADGLRQRLRLCGIRSTVHLDPVLRKAYVELWDVPNVDRTSPVADLTRL